MHHSAVWHAYLQYFVAVGYFLTAGLLSSHTEPALRYCSKNGTAKTKSVQPLFSSYLSIEYRIDIDISIFRQYRTDIELKNDIEASLIPIPFHFHG